MTTAPRESFVRTRLALLTFAMGLMVYGIGVQHGMRYRAAPAPTTVSPEAGAPAGGMPTGPAALPRLVV